MKLVALSVCVVALGMGCQSVVKYPPSGEWASTTKTLGVVKATSGPWPLSLNSLPPEQTFYSALREQAAKTYSVNRADVVLGEVTVTIGAEIVGTIRDWKASAEAGLNPAPVTAQSRPPSLIVEPRQELAGFEIYFPAIKSIYDRAWALPADIGDAGGVIVEVAVRRDGSIVRAKISRPSGHPSLDRSVQAALDRVKSLPPFPDGIPDLDHTFYIKMTARDKLRL